MPRSTWALALSWTAARSRRNEKLFSLLFIDIDGFKRYNEKYGHPQGNELLREFSRILKICMRDADLAARYGGEEFVLILPETPKSDAKEFAERLRHLVEKHNFAGPSFTITVSIGVVTYLEDAMDPSDMITVADQAMYRAKNSGGNMVI